MQFELPTELGGEATETVRKIGSATEAEVRRHLPTLTESLLLSVQLGDEVIPETGEVGMALAPGRLHWVVDPSRAEGVVDIALRFLRETLFHEMHHLARGWVMQGATFPTSFMDGVVAEGLATAFARDAAGERAPWAEYPDDVEAWVAGLEALPPIANYAEWMFLHPDGRRWIGYRAGTYVADRAIASSGRSAAELATTPTQEVLRLARS